MMTKALYLWGVVALVAIAAIWFGALSLGTNLFAAVGIGLIVVGGAKLFSQGNPTISVGLILGGALVWLGHELAPGLTIGSALASIGVTP